MDKYAVKGLKKLFSLTRTKIRLAEEAGTVETLPSPVPLARLFSCADLSTVAECKEHLARLRDEADFDDEPKSAQTALQLCDIIESVKYRFEPAEYMPLMGDDGLADVEASCRREGKPVVILLMTASSEPNSVFFGDEPPPGTFHYSRVVSGIAPLIRYAYGSEYLSDGKRLRNIVVRCGRNSLIADALSHAVRTLTAQPPR